MYLTDLGNEVLKCKGEQKWHYIGRIIAISQML